MGLSKVPISGVFAVRLISDKILNFYLVKSAEKREGESVVMSTSIDYNLLTI